MRPRRCGRSRGCRLDGTIWFYVAAPIVQPSGVDQAAVTLGNVDGEIAALTISDPPTRAEVQALRDKCEELAADVRALATLVHALRGALVAVGVVKGGGRRSPLGPFCSTSLSIFAG